MNLFTFFSGLIKGIVLTGLSFYFVWSFYYPQKTIAMNTQKILVSGIVGGIVSLLGGYLIYGVLLDGFFAKNTGTATGVMKDPAQMVWWAMILGSVCYGLFVSYIFSKWGGIVSFGKGLSAGFVLGLLVTAGFDFTMFGSSNISNLTGSLVDIVCGAVLMAIIGGVVGMMNGMGKKAAA